METFTNFGGVELFPLWDAQPRAPSRGPLWREERAPGRRGGGGRWWGCGLPRVRCGVTYLQGKGKRPSQSRASSPSGIGGYEKAVLGHDFPGGRSGETRRPGWGEGLARRPGRTCGRHPRSWRASPSALPSRSLPVPVPACSPDSDGVIWVCQVPGTPLPPFYFNLTFRGGSSKRTPYGRRRVLKGYPKCQ